MTWIVIIIFALFILLIIISKSGPEKNGIKIEIDVPNPEKCQDKTMIDFINSTPIYKLEAVFKEYKKQGLLLKPLFVEAFNKRMNNDLIKENKTAVQVDTSEKKESKKLLDSNSFTSKRDISQEDIMRFKTNKIDSEYLIPQKDLEDKSHEFYGKKIVITGTFSSFPYRNELAHLLWSVGADIDTSITKKVDVVILGDNPGWKKLELIEEFQPQVIDQKILLELFPNYEPKF